MQSHSENPKVLFPLYSNLGSRLYVFLNSIPYKEGKLYRMTCLLCDDDDEYMCICQLAICEMLLLDEIDMFSQPVVFELHVTIHGFRKSLVEIIPSCSEEKRDHRNNLKHVFGKCDHRKRLRFLHAHSTITSIIIAPQYLCIQFYVLILSKSWWIEEWGIRIMYGTHPDRLLCSVHLTPWIFRDIFLTEKWENYTFDKYFFVIKTRHSNNAHISVVLYYDSLSRGCVQFFIFT